MYNFIAHGLNIQSEMYFPEFLNGNSDPDVTIRFAKVIPFSSENIEEIYLSKTVKVQKIGKICLLSWNKIIICIIKEGKEIIINKKTDCDYDFIKLLILGFAFAILLHQRGRLVLHANAVQMNESAILFLGSEGKGKSTTSLSLHQRGYNLLADDVVSISFENDIPLIFPSYPRIKIMPKTLNDIGECASSIPKIHPRAEKRSYSTLDNFSIIKTPIKSIYILNTSLATSIKKLCLQDGLMELIRSAYVFNLFDQNDLIINLRQCVALINAIPVKMLDIQHSTEHIPELVKIIEQDVLG